MSHHKNSPGFKVCLIIDLRYVKSQLSWEHWRFLVTAGCFSHREHQPPGVLGIVNLGCELCSRCPESGCFRTSLKVKNALKGRAFKHFLPLKGKDRRFSASIFVSRCFCSVSFREFFFGGLLSPQPFPEKKSQRAYDGLSFKNDSTGFLFKWNFQHRAGGDFGGSSHQLGHFSGHHCFVLSKNRRLFGERWLSYTKTTSRGLIDLGKSEKRANMKLIPMTQSEYQG